MTGGQSRPAVVYGPDQMETPETGTSMHSSRHLEYLKHLAESIVLDFIFMRIEFQSLLKKQVSQYVDATAPDDILPERRIRRRDDGTEHRSLLMGRYAESLIRQLRLLSCEDIGGVVLFGILHRRL